MRIEPSQATLQLPLIDISGLRSADTSARHAVAQQLRQACEQRGFVYISGHGVDEALIAAVFAPFYYGLLFGADEKLFAVVAMSVLLLFRHGSNIANLLAGKESRIGSKAGGARKK